MALVPIRNSTASLTLTVAVGPPLRFSLLLLAGPDTTTAMGQDG